MSVERLAETMTGIWASAFAPSFSSTSSFTHVAMLLPFGAARSVIAPYQFLAALLESAPYQFPRSFPLLPITRS